VSEYQYYEFAAIDRPLTRAEMAELRAVSTRAVITPGSFSNHYEWGDLKADPADWMQSLFRRFRLFGRLGQLPFFAAPAKNCFRRRTTPVHHPDHALRRIQRG